jgi:hypothetical protein
MFVGWLYDSVQFPIQPLLTPDGLVYSCYYRQGFGLDIGFIDHLQVVTTNNYNTTTISTLYKIMLSPFHPTVSSLVVAWQWVPTMAASMLKFSLNGSSLPTISFLQSLLYRTDLVALTRTTAENPVSNSTSIVSCVSAAVGPSLPIWKVEHYPTLIKFDSVVNAPNKKHNQVTFADPRIGHKTLIFLLLKLVSPLAVT